MARYIDADALTDYMLERYNDLCDKHGDYDHYTTGYGDAIDAVDNAPTADVVPKSEVEKLIIDRNAARLGMIAEHERLKTEKADVAREIFAEIETLLALNILVGDVFTGKYFDADLENDIAELKKKYTEKLK